jgi:hypothetical protein
VTKAQIPASSALSLTIAGANTIPATGVTAVAINLTAANEAAGGYFIAYADGTTRPNTTAVSFATAAAMAGESIIPVGTNGKIDIYNASGGATDLIGDIVGYYSGASTTTGLAGQKYHPLDSTRLLDTRMTNTILSAVNPTLVINLTTTQETGSGLLIVYPGNSPTAPNTSNLDYGTASLANLDLAQTSNNTFTVANTSSDTHLIIDTDGYFANY